MTCKESSDSVLGGLISFKVKFEFRLDSSVCVSELLLETLDLESFFLSFLFKFRAFFRVFLITRSSFIFIIALLFKLRTIIGLFFSIFTVTGLSSIPPQFSCTDESADLRVSKLLKWAGITFNLGMLVIQVIGSPCKLQGEF